MKNKTCVCQNVNSGGTRVDVINLILLPPRPQATETRKVYWVPTFRLRACRREDMLSLPSDVMFHNQM